MTDILAVGQTPPPYYGQAIVIETILQGVYPEVNLHHLRMGFSRDVGEVGRFRLRKFTHLASLIGRTYWARVFRNTTVLYYPPAGPDLAPVVRDVIFLIAVRWLFKVTIFHFHAANVSDLYKRGSWILRLAMRLAYFNADIGIRPSRRSGDETATFHIRREYIVPYGIPDPAPAARAEPDLSATVSILYVGILREDKGVLTLLEAFTRLHARYPNLFLDLVGPFASMEFESTVNDFLQRHRLVGRVRLHGLLTGDAKWAMFAKADIFCFATYFRSESFGICLLEAQSFGIPVVASNWRGIPDIVDDGINGLLVNPKDPDALADQIDHLLRDPELRTAMGRSGRAKFEQEFTLERFRGRLGQIFRSAATPLGRQDAQVGEPALESEG